MDQQNKLSVLLYCCIAHCLLTLTEDNDTAIQWLCDHKEYLSLLESLLSSSDGYSIGSTTLVRALVVGEYHSVYFIYSVNNGYCLVQEYFIIYIVLLLKSSDVKC